MTKQDNINTMYNQLTVAGLKSKTIMAIADATGTTYDSVNNNWLHRGNPAKGKTPDKHIDTVIKIFQNAIRIQNNYINDLKVNL